MDKLCCRSWNASWNATPRGPSQPPLGIGAQSQEVPDVLAAGALAPAEWVPALHHVRFPARGFQRVFVTRRGPGAVEELGAAAGAVGPVSAATRGGSLSFLLVPVVHLAFGLRTDGRVLHTLSSPLALLLPTRNSYSAPKPSVGSSP